MVAKKGKAWDFQNCSALAYRDRHYIFAWREPTEER